MKQYGTMIVALVILAILAVFAVWFIGTTKPNTGSLGTSTNTSSTVSSTPPETLAFDKSISDGTITIGYPSADFGLATATTQILTHSYIPPCDASFKYCLYYVGTAYSGTNFESAGIRVNPRADLGTVSACLNTPPADYTNATSTISSSSAYAASVFPDIGDAAAGHFAAGALYRLSVGAKCYEFEARVGESDFLNYPSGTIKEFTATDNASITAEIQNILGSITLNSSGETINFGATQ
jgi:hypothetical protein